MAVGPWTGGNPRGVTLQQQISIRRVLLQQTVATVSMMCGSHAQYRRPSTIALPALSMLRHWPEAYLNRGPEPLGARNTSITCTTSCLPLAGVPAERGAQALPLRSADCSVLRTPWQRAVQWTPMACAWLPTSCHRKTLQLLNTALTCQPLGAVAWREDGLLIVEGGVQPLHLTQGHHCTGAHSTLLSLHFQHSDLYD